MTELVPFNSHLPERSKSPSFLALSARTATLTASALALKEGLWVLKRRMDKDADRADTLAEHCVEAEVEAKFIGLMEEAAAALRAVATASGELAGAADQVEANSREFGDAHQREYRGVYEAVQASGVQQAKAGFYRQD